MRGTAAVPGKALEAPGARSCLHWPDKRGTTRTREGSPGRFDRHPVKDDGHIEDLHVQRYYDKDEPRVNLELFEL